MDREWRKEAMIPAVSEGCEKGGKEDGRDGSGIKESGNGF